jgi:hypothetical protein
MPIDKSEYSEEFKNFVDEQIKNEYNLNGRYGFDWEIIGAEKDGTRITIYAWVMAKEYRYVDTSKGKMLIFSDIDHSPTIIVIDDTDINKINGKYSLVEYWRVSEGEYETDWEYVNAILSRFPDDLWDEALSGSNYEKRQVERCRDMVSEKSNN